MVNNGEKSDWLFLDATIGRGEKKARKFEQFKKNVFQQSSKNTAALITLCLARKKMSLNGNKINLPLSKYVNRFT